MPNLQIRQATVADAEQILTFITELAVYENAQHHVVATVDDIEKNLFSPKTTTQALICSRDGQAIGFAVYFLNFSTWLGKNGLYVEDLYISPQCRGIGAGKALLKHLAKIALRLDCGRLEWNVLDWNTPAIEFYESFGAKALDEWVGYRIEGADLQAFAGGE